MTQMITSTTNQHNDRLKKDAKSATTNSQEALGLMHDHHNNTYHSSLYRHQLQSRQQHHRSATATNLITSSLSCGSPSRSPLSLAAADPARPHSTPSCYSHSNNYYVNDDDHTDNHHPIDHSIDFNSLCDAMDDDDGDSHTTLRRRLFAPLLADDDDGHDSFDTMLSYLRKNDELAQQMDEIEQLENLSFLRVMYLGVTSAEEKHLLLKKVSDGLSESLFRQSPASPPAPSTTTTTKSVSASSDSSLSLTTNSSSGNNAVDENTNSQVPLAYGFRERKHHLLPLHLFLAGGALDDDYYDDHAAMFEDNGVSIVEADFSTDNNMTESYRKHNPDLILHYIYTQYQPYYSPTTLNNILNPPPQWANLRFDGHVFSEGAPNGIDLCVYFYHDAQKMADVTQDMDLLWKINALGIPVLPIMSMSNQTTTTTTSSASPLSSTHMETNLGERYSCKSTNDDDDELGTDDDDDDDDNETTFVKQRPIDIRRNELASLFSQWRIKMMDISNLDIIGQPSFQQRGNERKNSTQQDMVIEQRLGRTWATSSMTSSTPYHILTLFQFMAMDRWAVSKLLKTIQDRADERYTAAGTTTTTTITNDNDDTHLTARSMKSEQQHGTTVQHNDNNKTQPMMTPPPPPMSVMEQGPLTHTTQKEKQPQLVTIHLWLLYTLPLLVLVVFGLWMALTGLIGGILTALTKQPASTWHASLIMVSHTSGKSMTLMVNVYDGQHQPRWAPEAPVLWTNLHLPSPPPAATDSDRPNYSSTWKETTAGPILYVAAPLHNKTHFLEGQYFYSIRLPPCSLLDPELNHYTVQVKPSTILPSTTPGTVQGSPLHLPSHVLCDTTTTTTMQSDLVSSSDANHVDDDQHHHLMDAQEPSHLLEAWSHFRQYSRFYLMNGVKIVELIFTEGKEKN